MAEKRTAELKVTGMVCAACTAAIEKALKNLDGVSRAEINLGTEMASVEYDPEKLGLVDIEKTIRDVGYDVIDQKVVLKIGGMVCAMCVGALEIALKKLDGVVEPGPIGKERHVSWICGTKSGASSSVLPPASFSWP
jgi:Cu+-exporting ATPase